MYLFCFDNNLPWWFSKFGDFGNFLLLWEFSQCRGEKNFRTLIYWVYSLIPYICIGILLLFIFPVDQLFTLAVWWVLLLFPSTIFHTNLLSTDLLWYVVICISSFLPPITNNRRQYTLSTLHPLCLQILHTGWPPPSMQVATGLTEHLTMGNVDYSKPYFCIFVQHF